MSDGEKIICDFDYPYPHKKLILFIFCAGKGVGRGRETIVSGGGRIGKTVGFPDPVPRTNYLRIFVLITPL